MKSSIYTIVISSILMYLYKHVTTTLTYIMLLFQSEYESICHLKCWITFFKGTQWNICILCIIILWYQSHLDIFNYYSKHWAWIRIVHYAYKFQKLWNDYKCRNPSSHILHRSSKINENEDLQCTFVIICKWHCFHVARCLGIVIVF